MKRMNKAVATATVLGFVLAACGGSDEQSNSTTASEGSSEAAPEDSTGETLSFWTLQQSDSDLIAAQEAAVADFETEHGVDIDLITYPYVELQDKLLLAASSDAAPDVLLLDQIWVAQYAGAGFVDSIDDRMAAADIASADYFTGAWDSGFYDGSQYTVPFDVGVWALMYYNKDMFEAAGLDPDTPPETWDELFAAAETLTDAPNQYGIGSWVGSGDAPNCLFDALTFSGGGQVLDATTGKAAVNSPEGVAALEAYQRMLEYGADGAIARSAEDGLSLFTSEKAAITFYGEWGQDTIATRSPDLNYGVALLPVPDGGTSVGCFGGFNLGISSNSDNKDLAWEFIQYASGFDKQQEITMLTPAHQEAAAEYLDENRQYPDVILQQLEQASFRPLIPNYPEFADIQRVAIERTLLGEESAQDALDTAVEDMNSILD